MKTFDWQPKKPIEAIVFDCDGTLSQIEGIDELAEMNAVGAQVKAMTAEAMSTGGLNANLYQERLALTQPTQAQMATLGDLYFSHKTPDIFAVLQVLSALNKAIIVASAGLQPSIEAFAEQLNIPLKNVFAVDIRFDEAGHYSSFDKNCPLIENDGKRLLIQQLKTFFSGICHIGDGSNDFSARLESDRFVGYGGCFYRPELEELADYYILSKSILPVLPLVLTPEEAKILSGINADFYQQGLHLIQNGEVKIPSLVF